MAKLRTLISDLDCSHGLPHINLIPCDLCLEFRKWEEAWEKINRRVEVVPWTDDKNTTYEWKWTNDSSTTISDHAYGTNWDTSTFSHTGLVDLSFTNCDITTITNS